MAKRSLDVLIALLGIAAATIVGAITISQSLKTAKWGGTPPKQLRAQYIGPTDPLSDLTKPSSKLTIDVRSAGQKVSNLRVVQATLTNDGQTPILAADIFEPISLEANGAWKIVNVADWLSSTDGPKPRWHRVSETKFEADRLLINPGDRIMQTVYVTKDGDANSDETDKTPVTWHARINNLPRITIAPDIMEQVSSRQGPIVVHLFGWGVPFFILAYLIYNGLTFLLLARTKILVFGGSINILFLPLVGLLNIAAADASASYLFGADESGFFSVDPMANIPPLVGNFVMLMWLSFRTWGGDRASRSATTGDAA